MSISLLNNITALEAQNQLNQTNSSLQNTLVQLSSGSRLNSGADDPAGLSISNSLTADVAVLNQASNNANTGIGLTTFNSSSVFTATTTSFFLGSSSNSIGVTIGTLSSTGLNLNNDSLTTAAKAATALTDITAAVSTVAQDRGTLGATLNRLTAAQNVIANQVTNLTAANNLIQSANIPQDVSQEAQLSVLEQTGISSLSQANQSTQQILRLFQ